jgi:hypothetical protein
MLLTASAGVSAGLGIAAGGDVVFNFNTGQISLFGFVNYQAAGGISAGATAQGGFIWGLGNNNQSYAGPFTTISAGAGLIAGTLAGSSQGYTNPFDLNAPITATAGAQTPGANFSYGVASYTNPLNVGNLVSGTVSNMGALTRRVMILPVASGSPGATRGTNYPADC